MSDDHNEGYTPVPNPAPTPVPPSPPAEDAWQKIIAILERILSAVA
jgi:hypothetical protein